MTNLPAHLANRPSRGLVQRATQGMGSALPPHISTQGNTFTLIDAAGDERDAGVVLEAVIVDIGDVMAKRYMDPDKPWKPGSNDPPLCWSSNGVGPSIEATQPQAATCTQCPNNVRGSKVSEFSGASIKACRDELFTALLIPKHPGMLFRLVVTPGSFKNWQAFIELFKGRGFEFDAVLTQISFEPKKPVLQFKPLRHNDIETMKLVDAALAEKKTDALVGRLDRPRGGVPVPQPIGIAQSARPLNDDIGSGYTQPPVQIASPRPAASPSEAPKRGRPRKQAESVTSEPARAPDFGAGSRGVAQAPFMTSDPPADVAGNSGFGIASPAKPDADMQQAIDNMFGPQGG